MDTKKIYYEDQYTKEFESIVISCETAKDGVFHVALEATAFYPEGGGQPADIGQLCLKSTPEEYVQVTDVREKSGVVAHVTNAPIAVGEAVIGRIDWEHRFSLMQQHTGEHIISGLVHKLYGLDNVGFHMGAGFTTMDINGELTTDELKELDFLANRAIYENAQVYSRYPSTEELNSMEYRSKKALTGDVRIVTVEGYDRCACCGLHCRLAGEVGIIKLVQAQKYKSGMRFYMLSGQRAFEDYYRKNGDIYALSQLFSAKPDEVVAAARQCHSENVELKRQLAAYKLRALQDRAGQITEGQSLVCLFEEDLTPDDLRRLCMLVCEKAVIAAVFSGEEGLYRYAVGSVSVDVRELGKRMNSALDGRGGGQKNLVQGTVKAGRAGIEEFCGGEA